MPSKKKATKRPSVKRTVQSFVTREEINAVMAEEVQALIEEIERVKARVASLERSEHDRLYPPVKNSFAFQSSR